VVLDRFHHHLFCRDLSLCLVLPDDFVFAISQNHLYKMGCRIVGSIEPLFDESFADGEGLPMRDEGFTLLK